MSDDKSSTAEPEVTGAAATRHVRKALDDAGIGPGDYELHSRKTDDGAESVVAVSGWAYPELVALIAAALKEVEGSPRISKDGRTFTLKF